MGLGTTAVAAIREGRRYIGIDYVAEYVKKAAARIALESAGRRMTLYPNFRIDSSIRGGECV